jgi:transposase
MRGEQEQQDAMFSYVSAEKRVPQDHPLRGVRRMCDEALWALSARFDELYSHTGRPSIPPEQLLRALLLQVLYTVRSERLLMEQMDYNLLFRWFVGLRMDDTVWDATVFSKNRERLIEGEIAAEFLEAVLGQARRAQLLSDEHFSVDGTLVQAWAGQKSFQPKSGAGGPVSGGGTGNEMPDFRGQKRSNETHQSRTDPDSRLYRKADGAESKLAYLGHVLMDNRNGLVSQVRLTAAHGKAERQAAVEMIAARTEGGKKKKRITVGADKGYDTKDAVRDWRQLGATPHVAQITKQHPSAIDGRTTGHVGYAMSQKVRKRIEEVFGWMKTVGLVRQTKLRGVERVGWMFAFAAAAYNLVRMRRLMPLPG